MLPATFTKHPEELRTYSFNFERQLELVGGANIASVDATYPQQTPSTGASVLTFGGNQILSPRVQFTVSGGTAGIKYFIEMLVTLNTGAKLKAFGVISVTEPSLADM